MAEVARSRDVEHIGTALRSTTAEQEEVEHIGTTNSTAAMAEVNRSPVPQRSSQRLRLGPSARTVP